MENKLNPAFEKLIKDQRNWPLFQKLLDAAAAIVGDFDSCGEVLQSNEAGMYDETTSIEQLRGAIFLIDPDMVPRGDYHPWLTEEQQKKLETVAAEVLVENNVNDTAETMTPSERLGAIGYPCEIDKWVEIKKRLGFDPFTGEAV